MTYLAYPFHVHPDRLKSAGHSNAAQAVDIARALNRLGYVVDIADWLDSTFVPTEHYDVFFGMHYNFGRLLPYMGESTVKIYYGTGSYWAHEMAAEQDRIEDLKRRRGTEIKLPIRLGENDWVQVADAVIVVGNEFTASTYRPHNPMVFPIDNYALLTTPPDLEHKDFLTARRNFLAFPSTGLLHKGLDLILEVFAALPDVDLWVCGPLESAAEQGFIRIYRRELFHTTNIHPIGWTDIYSRRFGQLTDKCAFVVLPSCAEGMPGGVLNCMGRGMIPLVSREAAIDTDGCGITLPESSVNTIRQVVCEMADTSPEVCRHMAQEAYSQASTRYSPDSFRRNIERILARILEGK